MRNFIKKITHPFLKFGLNAFYSKPRNFSYENIALKIHPDVFPPHMTFSTKILLDFVKELNLEHKTFLELGCGSGIISLFAAKKGAIVTASDINETALKYLEKNALKNNLQPQIKHSDLFENLKNEEFEYIIINPPYYPKNPKNINEQAWFCGKNFEYFERLFMQLPNYLSEQTNCFMILSQDCDIEKIKSIALKNLLYLKCIKEKTVIVEKNFIFKIETLTP